MPKNNTAATALEPKTRRAFVALAIFAFGLLLVSAYLRSPEGPIPVVNIGNHNIGLWQAKTPDQKMHGLSGVNKMPTNRGLLFYFYPEESGCLWMKDMRFSLDMVWLDYYGKVLKVEHNASPDTYPQTFCPPSHASNAIELNAGQAKDVKPGDILHY